MQIALGRLGRRRSLNEAPAPDRLPPGISISVTSVFYIGFGDKLDSDELTAYPPGAVIFLPGNTSHFHFARSGEYVTQVSAVGPLGLEYLEPDDDPRLNEAAGMPQASRL